MPRQYSSWVRRQVVVRLRSGESVSTSHPHQANNKKSQQAAAGSPESLLWPGRAFANS